MVAFHSYDNGIWATGWAVDDVVLGQSVDPIFSYYTGYYNLYRYNLDGANATTELFANTSNMCMFLNVFVRHVVFWARAKPTPWRTNPLA